MMPLLVLIVTVFLFLASLKHSLMSTIFNFVSGIPPHTDTHSAFEDGIISLSLGSQVCLQHYFFCLSVLEGSKTMI